MSRPRSTRMAGVWVEPRQCRRRVQARNNVIAEECTEGLPQDLDWQDIPMVLGFLDLRCLHLISVI